MATTGFRCTTRLESKWKMNFHTEKCQDIRKYANRRFQRETTNTLHGHILEAVESSKYLGVTICKDMRCKIHTNIITAKAPRIAGFISTTAPRNFMR